MEKIKKLSDPAYLDKKFDKVFKKPFYSIIAILIGIGVGMAIIAILGADAGSFMPFLFQGSFSSLPLFGNWLANISWLTFAGLAFAVAYKVKQFNIGLVAQMLFAAIFSYWLGFYVNMGPIGFLVIILLGGLIGSTVALTIGFLKTKLRVNEVISSIMLNWIALRFLQWFTDRSVFNDPDGHTSATGLFTKPLSSGAGGTQNAMNYGLENAGLGAFNWTIILAVVLVIVLGLVYKFTTWGQKTKIMSSSPKVAKVTGIKDDRVILQSYAISGLLAGFAGIALHLGVDNGALSQDSTVVPTQGFQGIAVSLIGYSNPFAILPVTFFFSALETSTPLIASKMPVEAVQIVSGLIILISTTIVFFLSIDWRHKTLIFKERRKIYLETKYSENIPSVSKQTGDYMKDKLHLNSLKNKVKMKSNKNMSKLKNIKIKKKDKGDEK